MKAPMRAVQQLAEELTACKAERDELASKLRIAQGINERLMRAIGAPLPPSPFECSNCGYKPNAHEVIQRRGDCPKCGDVVQTFTIDAAQYIQAIMLRIQPPHG